MYDVVVKEVHVRYLISWWVSCLLLLGKCLYSCNEQWSSWWYRLISDWLLSKAHHVSEDGPSLVLYGYRFIIWLAAAITVLSTCTRHVLTVNHSHIDVAASCLICPCYVLLVWTHLHQCQIVECLAVWKNWWFACEFWYKLRQWHYEQ